MHSSDRLLRHAIGALLLAAIIASGALAQETPPAPPEKPGDKKSEDDKGKEGKEGKDAKEKEPKEVKPIEKKGQITLAGQPLRYVAQTGTMPILKDDGSARANVFYVYYA